MKLDHLIFIGLALALVFTSLSRGAVEPGYRAIFELLVLALIVLFSRKVLKDSMQRVNLPIIVWPLVALLTLGLVQSIAWTDSNGIRQSLSFDVEATRSTVLALFFLIAVVIVAANVFNTRERLFGAAHFLTFYGLALAVFALSRYFVLQTYSDTPDEMVQGMFVNHNHFAGHLEMLLPIPIALVITNAVPDKRMLFAFAAIVIGVVAIATLSRGGMISTGVEMLFLLVASWRVKLSRRYERKAAREQRESFLNLILRRMGWPTINLASHTILLRVAMIVLVTGAIIASVLWLNHQPVIQRVTRGTLVSDQPGVETFFTSRGWIWKDTMAMIAANPLTGVGLGAYATAYPIYCQQDRRLAPEQAHSDYLQILADAGLLGAVLALSFLVLAVREIARSLRSRDPLLAGIVLGSGAGIIGLLVHSIFDFNLQLTANSLLFLLLITATSCVSRLTLEARASEYRWRTSTEIESSATSHGCIARGANAR